MKSVITVLMSFLIACSVLGQESKTMPQKGIFVQPAVVQYNLASGGMGNKTISLINRLDQPKQFRLYIGDWERDSNGRHVYYPPGTKPYSCSRWVSLDQTFVEVPPGMAIPINIRMQLPDSVDAAAAMKWSMLFIEMINEAKPIADTGVTTSLNQLFRMAIHLYQTPPTVTLKEMRMIGFDTVSLVQDSVYFRFTCKNEGEVQIRCRATIELTNLATGEKKRLPHYDFPMFPGHRRHVYIKLPADTPKGRYSILGVMDAGEDLPLEAVQKEIEVK